MQEGDNGVADLPDGSAALSFTFDEVEPSLADDARADVKQEPIQQPWQVSHSGAGAGYKVTGMHITTTPHQLQLTPALTPHMIPVLLFSQ